MYHKFSRLSELEAYSLSHKFTWFKRDTMQFFSSKLYGTPMSANSEDVSRWNYFISSEMTSRGLSEGRRYTIRRMDESGDIETIGDFQQYATLSLARKALKALLV